VGRYLDQLKQIGNGQKGYQQNQQNPEAGGYAGFDGTPPPCLEKIQSAVVNNETVATLILAKACGLTGYALEQIPEQLRADLLAGKDASAEYMAHVIRDDAEWYGWAGQSVALADYAPGGRFYVDH